MKYNATILLLLLTCAVAPGLINSPNKNSQAESHWQSLFNGKDLTGWETYLGPPLDATGKKLSDVPVGLNNDPNHVFTIVEQNGEKLIRVSGENWGAVTTKKEYENFHLKLMFKWGSLQWGQKKYKKKDSGLLYFSVGPQGADYGAWMRSQEFQIEEGNCGEFWGVAGGIEDIHALKKSDSEYVYDPASPLLTFSATSTAGRHCKKAIDAENTTGKWNSLDLFCYKDSSVHVINGKVMMILVHSRQLENGNILPLTKGKLQIQSEGAEVFYKDILIEPIKKLPPELLQ